MPTDQPTPEPTVVIEAEWPKKMEHNRSDTIRISLIRTEAGYVPTAEVPGHETLADTPVPVGTPDVPLEEAFGTDYSAFAVARLGGSAFDAEPLAAEEQPLDQEKITWEWNVTPKSSGKQVVDARIDVRFEPTESGEEFNRQIWHTRLDIDVTKPWIATGQLNMLSLVGGLVGSGLSIPWLYERAKRRFRAKPAEEAPSAPRPRTKRRMTRR